METTVAHLKEIGCDVLSITGEGMGGTADHHVLSYAIKDQRILLTYDSDFADIRELTDIQHYGIIHLRVSNQRAFDLHPLLEKAFEQLRDVDLKNKLITLTDQQIRIRSSSC